jgi:plasmid stabilization system protein ParE
MSYSLNIHPEAAKEFYGAIEWYDGQSAGLGVRFEQEILAVLRAISTNPELGSFIRGKYRQVVTPLFPFVIVYKMADESDTIFVSAIFHTSRNPKNKFRQAQ